MSLEKQTFGNFEVIVIDNAKNQAVRSFVESIQTRWTRRVIYAQSENSGYTGGNVTGLRFVKGDLILIINSDVILEAGTLLKMVNGFELRPKEVMVLVPKILIRDSNIINSVGMRRIRPTENLYTNIGYQQFDKGQYDVSRKVEAFDGSAFMFRKRLLQYTYLFDQNFFFGNETVDLAERMNNLGLSAWTCPEAIVRHELRGTVKSSRENDWLISIIVRNSLIHTMRNTNLSMFMRTLIIGILARNVFGRVLLNRSNTRLALLYLRGVAMFLVELGSFTRAAAYNGKPRG